jgi:hypothetical protein
MSLDPRNNDIEARSEFRESSNFRGEVLSQAYYAMGRLSFEEAMANSSIALAFGNKAAMQAFANIKLETKAILEMPFALMRGLRIGVLEEEVGKWIDSFKQAWEAKALEAKGVVTRDEAESFAPAGLTMTSAQLAQEPFPIVGPGITGNVGTAAPGDTVGINENGQRIEVTNGLSGRLGVVGRADQRGWEIDFGPGIGTGPSSGPGGNGGVSGGTGTGSPGSAPGADGQAP